MSQRGGYLHPWADLFCFWRSGAMPSTTKILFQRRWLSLKKTENAGSGVSEVDTAIRLYQLGCWFMERVERMPVDGN